MPLADLLTWYNPTKCHRVRRPQKVTTRTVLQHVAPPHLLVLSVPPPLFVPQIFFLTNLGSSITTAISHMCVVRLLNSLRVLFFLFAHHYYQMASAV